jgi:hypothetical protein
MKQPPRPTQLPNLPKGYLAIPDVELPGYVYRVRGERVDIVACSAWAHGFRAWGIRKPQTRKG